MRMSMGPSRRKLIPRPASSSCGELTPRSAHTPSTCETPSDSSASATAPKFERTIRTRSPNARRRSPAAVTALASRSNAMTRAPGHASRIASVCPPPPSVASM
jgi:hypothetical protein